MNTYLVTGKFYYDGKLQCVNSHIILANEPEFTELGGESFDSLWEFCSDHPRDTNLCLWDFGKKFIQEYDAIFRRITSKNCKPWKYVVSSEETNVSMERLMRFDSESVIKYLKERGVTTCPMIF